MNITGVKQTSAIMPVGRPEQDSREKNIQRQITNLQEKVRNVTYDKEMSEEEKSSQKKELQEKIQSLNSELKQYQLQKQQEEDAERQQAARRGTDNTSANAVNDSVKASVGASDSADHAAGSGRHNTNREDQKDKRESGFSDAESGVIITISHTKDQLSSMKKIRTDLEGRMRTAGTDEEKKELQKRIQYVSKSMGEKIQKIADTIADSQKEDQERKDKISRLQKENEERMKNINVVVSNAGEPKAAEHGYVKENFTLSIT